MNIVKVGERAKKSAPWGVVSAATHTLVECAHCDTQIRLEVEDDLIQQCPWCGTTGAIRTLYHAGEPVELQADGSFTLAASPPPRYDPIAAVQAQLAHRKSTPTTEEGLRLWHKMAGNSEGVEL